jgi:myo-inositol-1(or 4)-monophosphatase
MAAAADLGYLQEHNVGAVLNCAVNADIDYVHQPYDPEAPKKLNTYGYSPIRYYKLGLVDGPGNPPELMLAGYYLLCGIVGQIMPDKASYPNQFRGNILVNCRAGRSRSIGLMSIYLHLRHTDQFPKLEDAISHIQEAREIHPDERFDAPNSDIIDLIETAVTVIKGISSDIG